MLILNFYDCEWFILFDNYDYPINLIVSVFGSYPDNWKVPKDLNETVEFIVKELGIIEGTINMSL